MLENVASQASLWPKSENVLSRFCTSLDTDVLRTKGLLRFALQLTVALKNTESATARVQGVMAKLLHEDLLEFRRAASDQAREKAQIHTTLLDFSLAPSVQDRCRAMAGILLRIKVANRVLEELTEQDLRGVQTLACCQKWNPASV